MIEKHEWILFLSKFYFSLKIRHTTKSRGCWQFRVAGSKWFLVTLIGQVSRLIRASKKISVCANCFSLMRLLHSTAHRVAKGNVARIIPWVSKLDTSLLFSLFLSFPFKNKVYKKVSKCVHPLCGGTQKCGTGTWGLIECRGWSSNLYEEELGKV